jgi:hypothetical protein
MVLLPQALLVQPEGKVMARPGVQAVQPVAVLGEMVRNMMHLTALVVAVVVVTAPKLRPVLQGAMLVTMAAGAAGAAVTVNKLAQAVPAVMVNKA